MSTSAERVGLYEGLVRSRRMNDKIDARSQEKLFARLLPNKKENPKVRGQSCGSFLLEFIVVYSVMIH